MATIVQPLSVSVARRVQVTSVIPELDDIDELIGSSYMDVEIIPTPFDPVATNTRVQALAVSVGEDMAVVLQPVLRN